MNHRHRLFAIAMIALLPTTVLSSSQPAAACDPSPPRTPTTILSDDTPECAMLTADDGFLAVENDCDDTVTLEAIECPGCKETLLDVEPGERESLGLLEGMWPVEVSTTQSLSWTAGDTSGTIEIQAAPTTPAGADCDMDCAVTLPGGRGQSTSRVRWAALLLVLVQLGRRRASSYRRARA